MKNKIIYLFMVLFLVSCGSSTTPNPVTKAARTTIPSYRQKYKAGILNTMIKAVQNCAFARFAKEFFERKVTIR